MKIDKNSFEVQYDLVNKFINAVDANDVDTLKKEFGLTIEIIEEIYEELDSYFEERPKISILSFNEAFSDAEKEKGNYDIFKFNDVECWGIDCKILVNEKIDDPIFHFRICKYNEKYNLEFLYIGS